MQGFIKQYFDPITRKPEQLAESALWFWFFAICKSKNRPMATNFQFLKILAPLGQLLVGACLPQTLLGTITANWKSPICIINHNLFTTTATIRFTMRYSTGAFT